MTLTKTKRIQNFYFPVRTLEDVKRLTKNAKRSGFMAIQLGTSGKDPHSDTIHTMWIATREDQPAAMIKMQSLDPMAEGCLKKLFTAKKIKKVYYDSIQACAFLKKAGFAIEGKKFDLLLAFKLLNAGLVKKRLSLADIIKKYLAGDNGFSLLLEEETNFTSQGYFNRSAKKVTVLLALREMLIDDLRADHLIETAELEFSCVSADIELWLTGIGIDTEKLQDILKRAETECNRNEEKLKAYFSDTVNIRSSKSLMEVFNNHPEMKAKRITFKETSKSTLKYYVKTFPILQAVLDYRYAKVFVDAASQVLRFNNIGTDRVYPFYDPLGAVTGRFSSNSPPLQAMPKSKEFRACFIAGEGKKFVIADYSQIELRILAEISGDIRMINAFIDGIDFHSLTAAIISGKRISDITSFERTAAKAINFGIAFGMGPAGLVTYALDNYDVELSLKEAKNFQRDFFDEYQGLYEWSQKQATMKSCITRTIGGRVRRWKDNRVSSTELLNTPIQGTAADVLKYALWILSDRLTELDALLVGCIHDEIILEVDENNADYVAEELINIMEEAGNWYLERVPVVVDVKIGDYWS